MHPAEWRDITILVPSRSSFAALEETLHPLFGIPVAFEKGKRYFDRGEIGDLTTAIRMLAFPEDRAAALGFLASSFLRADHGTVRPVPRAGGPVASGGLSGNGSQDRGAAERRALLRSLRGAGAAAERPSRSWGPTRCGTGRARWPTSGRGSTSSASTKKSSATTRPGAPPTSPAWRGAKGRARRVRPLGEEEDVVRVLTVHSAKGLEIPDHGGDGSEQHAGRRRRTWRAHSPPRCWARALRTILRPGARRAPPRQERSPVFWKKSKSERSGNASSTSRRPEPWTASSSAPPAA